MLAKLLSWLVNHDGGAWESGRRVEVVAHIAKLHGAASTQRELSTRCDLSLGRVNAICQWITQELRKIGNPE